MQDVIELAIATADGVADCRLERLPDDDDGKDYSVVILYPHQVGGRLISKVYEHKLLLSVQGQYCFAEPATMHPDVRGLEKQLSEAILGTMKK